MKKFLYLFTAALILLVCFPVFFRLQITSFVVIQALKRAGMTNIVFTPTILNRHTLVVSRFAATLSGPGSKFAGNDLRITWDRSIFSSKQVNTIVIKTLELNPARSSTQSLPVSPQHRLAAIMRNLQTIRPFLDNPGSLLPFHRLQIKQLFLTGKNAGPFRDRVLSLNIEKGQNTGNNKNITAHISLSGEHLNMRVTATGGPTLVAQLGKTGRQEPFIQARVTLHDSGITSGLRADLAGLPAVTPFLAASLPGMKGKLACTITLSGRKKPHLDADMDLSGFNHAEIGFESGSLHLHGVPEPGQGIVIRGEAILKHTILQQAGTEIDKIRIILHKGLLASRQRLRAEISTTANNLSSPQFHCDSITIPMISAASSIDKTLVVRVKAQQPFICTGVKGPGYTLPRIRLLPNQDFAVTTVMGRSFPWSVSPGSWRITTDAMGREDLVLAPDSITFRIQKLEGKGSVRHLQATITCPEMHLQAGKTGLSISDISLELRGDNTEIHGNGVWKLKPLPGRFVLQLSHNLKTGKGDAVIATTEPVLFSQDRPLSSAVAGWSLPADLTGGGLRVKSVLRWPPPRMRVRISLNNGRGFFRDIHFSGLDTSQNLEILPVLRSRSTGPLTLTALDAGIPIHNLATELRIKPSGKPLPIIILKNSHASLLGGEVSNDYIHLDPQQPALETTIRIHDLHLADLLTLQQVKGLKVTGSVSGELPIRLDKAGFHIDNGRLHNEQDGGVIEYTPPGDNGLRDSPLTGYALKALEEFHYNLLAASANYSPDGNLEVDLHLEGNSPKLDTKRPVHLNIATRQNLLSLMQSLRYSDSLTNEIDREVQQHFQKKSDESGKGPGNI